MRTATNPLWLRRTPLSKAGVRLWMIRRNGPPRPVWKGRRRVTLHGALVRQLRVQHYLQRPTKRR
jgi:hypothetical protein